MSDNICSIKSLTDDHSLGTEDILSGFLSEIYLMFIRVDEQRASVDDRVRGEENASETYLNYNKKETILSFLSEINHLFLFSAVTQ
jgi:hypothetical protein